MEVNAKALKGQLQDNLRRLSPGADIKLLLQYCQVSDSDGSTLRGKLTEKCTLLLKHHVPVEIRERIDFVLAFNSKCKNG